ncbi:MAG: hypothetical protein NVS2B7_23480 [Herpetosiphon sp.]
MAQAGQVADTAAAANVFLRYRQRLGKATRDRHAADLACFTDYLYLAGIEAGELLLDPLAWAGMSWGLVAGFIEWQLQQGYAIGSVNVRLSTVKLYCQLALQAEVLDDGAYARIKVVKGIRHKAGVAIDKERITTRRSTKKAESLVLSREQVQRLKQQPATPQGCRDALLMCLLLDHGLRCGEVVGLQVEHLDLQAGTLRFYREKVDLEQTHRLSPATHRAARAYLAVGGAPGRGQLLRGSRKNGELWGGMDKRAVNKRVALLGAAVGVPRLSPHDCRHTWATIAVRNGSDLKRVQDGGGWKSPHMPLRYAQRAAIANEGIRLDDPGEIPW